VSGFYIYLVTMKGKSILFIDWNGTLNNENFFRSLDTETYQKIQMWLFEANKQMVIDWMKGRYTSEQVVAQVAHHLGIPFEDLWDVFVDDCMTMSLSQGVVDTLHSLRESYILILITGNMDCFTRFTVPALKLNEIFDEISSSHDAGQLKDEKGGEVFLQYAEKYNVPISETHLFDDSDNVCRIFETLGGTAHLVSTQNPLEVHLLNTLNHSVPVH